MSTAQQEKSTDVAVPDFSDDELRSISSLEDIATLVGGQVVNATERLGTGFSIADADDKARLCGVPLVFLSWTFNQGDHGVFCSAYVVELSKTGQVVNKWIVNDGSMKSGIAAQLLNARESGVDRGLFVPNGLRRSDYTFTGTDGSESPATTFYLDLSA